MTAKEDLTAQQDSILADYQRLRDWYLARLRQEAVKRGAEHLTPAALVAADKVVVENLVLAAAGQAAPGAVKRGGGRRGLWTALAAISWMASAVVLLATLDWDMVRCLEVIIRSTIGLPFGFADAALPVNAVIPAAAVSALSFLALALAVLPPVAAGVLEASLLATAGLVMVALLVAINLDVTASPESKRLLSALAGWTSIVLLSALYAQRKSAVRLTRSHDEMVGRESLIADVSPALLCLLTADGRLLAWNATLARLSGAAPSELYRTKLEEFLSPESRPAFATSLEHRAQSIETRFTTGDKKLLDVVWTLEWSQTGQTYFAVGEDVTSERVLQRTRDEFVAMIGHDIRTPLSAVCANLQSLEAGVYGQLTTPVADCVDRSYRNSRRLVSMISEMLDFEKLRAGKMILACTEVDIAKLVDSAVADCADLAAQKSITVKSDVGAVVVRADAEKILRVLINLIANAIKYSPADSSVQVSANVSATYVEVRVTDQGPGIEPQDQSLVFERYQRLHQSEGSEGTGLGLAICKAIVESHGGLVGVHSKPPDGSTFWFTLPLSK